MQKFDRTIVFNLLYRAPLELAVGRARRWFDELSSGRAEIVGQSLRSAAASAVGSSRLRTPRRSAEVEQQVDAAEAALFNLPTKPSTVSAACRATSYASR